ncbi:hypothetical protein Tco_0777617 [Tanacetum coccineum]
MRILSVISIDVFSIYEYDYMKQIVLQRADNQEYTIAENDFKDLYQSDFEDMYLLNLQGSSEGSGTTPEVPDEPKDNSAVVAEKQAGYVQTNLTLSSAELEIQSMVDVPIHQEDLAVQRTPLIDPVISMVTEKTASTPTPPTTQAHTQASTPPSMCQTISNIDAHVEGEQVHESKQSRYEFPRSRQSRRDLPRDNSLVSVEVLRYDYKRSNVNKGIVRTEMELVLEHTQQGTSNEVSDYIKMEMQIPCSSRVKFIATCSFSRLNDFITSRKNDPKLPQTLISTSSSVCQRYKVMYR